MYDQTSRETIAEKFYDLGAIAMLMRASPELLETGGISKEKCVEIYNDFFKKSQKLKLIKGDRIEYYDPSNKGDTGVSKCFSASFCCGTKPRGY